MTEKEIELYFPYNKEDNIYDLYEERLFEQKQFFLTKPIISRVFNAKVEKLKKFEIAFRKLSNQNLSSIKTKNEQFFVFTKEEKSILNVYNQYQNIKNQFKLLILKANNSIEIIELIEEILEVTREYLSLWPKVDVEEDVIISKEPNPMDILSSIKEFNLINGFEFSDIIRFQNKCPKPLQLESKRLSLQLNILNNG